MFLIGLEFDLELIRKRMRSAVFVSWAGIATPFSLGALLAWGLMDRFALFAPGVKVWEAALFLGSAMSITAFPMLARIISERGLSGTALGTLALAAGALDDAAAWCLLAVVLASFTGKMSIALLALFGGAFYGLFMFTLGRKLLARLFAWLLALPSREPLVLPAALTLLMLAAWFTDRLGIYAVFGAFILGAAMPRGGAAKALRNPDRTADHGLPAADLLHQLRAEHVALAHRLADDAGRRGAAAGGGDRRQGRSPAAVAARLGGESKKDAFAIGALMNARGLMELILLNIGYERGMITQTLFTILVTMAVVTTMMAVPLFNFVYREGERVPT